jgi:ubiquinone/menaquinone biosynthesis C-methylase UbiE
MDLEQLKQASRVGWGKGEYSGLSEILRPAAQELCDACAVGAGQEVLDVAAGDGNFAIACAFEGASVVASDISPGMVERGKIRSEAEGYDVEWVEADAEELPFEDGRFECVGSVFGAVMAPRPEVVARELFRVVRPGNTVGLVSWIPEGVAQEMFSVTRKYTPPSQVPSHSEWGREEVVRERFGPYANTIETERRSLPFSAESPEAFVAHMERHAPMQVAAREAMPTDQYADMREDFLALVRGWAGGDGPFSVDAEYLVVVARKRG